VAALSEGALATLKGALGELGRNLRSPVYRDALRAEFGLIPKALRYTLPALIRANGEKDASILKAVLENATIDPFGLALEMGDERYTWSALDEKTSRVAHVLAAHGVKKGDVVAIIGANSPLYLASVFGINRIGGTAALVNHHLVGHPLSHAVTASKARVAIVEAGCAEAFHARDDLKDQLDKVFTFNSGDFEDRLNEAPAHPFPRVPMGASEDYVYIYTSGTTGLPKPCRVTHARGVAAGASCGPLFFGFKPGDKLYNVLPLYHSNALILGVGSCVMTRTPMAMRSSFSSKAFWDDVRRYDATAMLYIGELCRYLLNTAPCDAEVKNSIRIALGNGLRADVWGPFQQRFHIPEIREFYGATEAPGIIVNLTGKQGSVGRVPMRRLSRLRVVRYDIDTDDYLRDSRGFCIECRAGEVGELMIRLDEESRSAATEFRGYTDAEATSKKVVNNVFEHGDRYYRSGDLMRYDEQDYFFFVDRIGDTYRWKGENVSTAEVADVLSQTPGIREVTVCGVHVPGMEGQAGLAGVVCEGSLDLGELWRVAQELPAYAQPRFVRVMDGFSTTATFKVQKTALRKEGIDPVAQAGRIHVRQDTGYVPLTVAVWRDVQEGRARL
jgi:fatty-acyl-CoA synthase